MLTIIALKSQTRFIELVRRHFDKDADILIKKIVYQIVDFERSFIHTENLLKSYNWDTLKLNDNALQSILSFSLHHFFQNAKSWSAPRNPRDSRFERSLFKLNHCFKVPTVDCSSEVLIYTMYWTPQKLCSMMLYWTRFWFSFLVVCSSVVRFCVCFFCSRLLWLTYNGNHLQHNAMMNYKLWIWLWIIIMLLLWRQLNVFLL